VRTGSQPLRSMRAERVWTQRVAVLRELFQEPGPPDSTRVGVTEDVNLPAAKSNVALGCGEH
jgi:hypothetical protein